MAGIFDQITGQIEAGQTNIERNNFDDAFAGDEVNEEAESESETHQMEDAPEARTDRRLRETSQELLRFGLLEENQKPNLYRAALMDMTAVNAILEPLDLSAGVDEIRGLIFLKIRKTDTQDELDEWTHPLVRKQRFTLEQSLLVAILRQYFIAYEQEAGTGATQAIVAVDELIPQLQVYLGDTGSEAKERNRIVLLLDQLKGHGLVSAPDVNERITIRPIIAHLANPENLQALLNGLREQVAADNQPGTNEEAQ